MKYLSWLLPVLFLSACDSKPSCFNLTGEEVTLSVEVNHNLDRAYINCEDTLVLSISFSEELLNEKSNQPFDITPHDPSFALFIKDQTSTDSIDQLPQYPDNAKEQFNYEIIEGEELDLKYYLLNDVSEAINIRPAFSQGQYSLKIQLYPKLPGYYMAYLNYLLKDFLVLEGDTEKELPNCKDLIKVKINNSLNTNQLIPVKAELVQEFGLSLFAIDH